jgi:branched-subunit amino acid ABC-type transport system permease component
MTTLYSTFLGIDSLREVGQAAVSGVIAGSSYALLGVAFALILGVTGRFHFAFATVYTFSAYVSAVVLGAWGLPLLPACLVGLTIGVVLGVAIEAFVYRPLAARASANALLGVFVAALGLVIAGENFIRLAWGNDARNMRGFPDHTFTIANVNFTLVELTLVVASIVLVVALAQILDRTVVGQQIKAVRGNQDMAQAVGVDVRRTFLLVFAIGSLLAGVAAVFDGIRFAAQPDMGNTAVFYAFVVAFVAGVERSPIVVGAVGLGIGVVESLSTIWVSDNMSALTVFGLLLLWLTVRVLPQAVRQLSGAMSRTHSVRTARARASAAR